MIEDAHPDLSTSRSRCYYAPVPQCVEMLAQLEAPPCGPPTVYLLP
jgi:hypothetical protein